MHQIGQIAGKHLAQRFTQQRMIAADAEHAPSAEEIKITGAGAIEKILALTSAKSDVEAKRLQYANHHFVQMLRVQRIALRFALRQHGAYVEGPPGQIGCRLINSHIFHARHLACLITRRGL